MLHAQRSINCFFTCKDRVLGAETSDLQCPSRSIRGGRALRMSIVIFTLLVLWFLFATWDVCTKKIQYSLNTKKDHFLDSKNLLCLRSPNKIAALIFFAKNGAALPKQSFASATEWQDSRNMVAD